MWKARNGVFDFGDKKPHHNNSRTQTLRDSTQSASAASGKAKQITEESRKIGRRSPRFFHYPCPLAFFF
jgi:hypothetical protein